jgi:hypothetical protein
MSRTRPLAERRNLAELAQLAQLSLFGSMPHRMEHLDLFWDTKKNVVIAVPEGGLPHYEVCAKTSVVDTVKAILGYTVYASPDVWTARGLAPTEAHKMPIWQIRRNHLVASMRLCCR